MKKKQIVFLSVALLPLVLFGEKPSKINPLDSRQQSIISRIEKSSPCTRGTGDYPIPRVTSYNQKKKAFQGLNLVIKGTNFIEDRVKVCIGLKELTLTAKSTNEITAQLPATSMQGDLIVSHGSRDSAYPLEEGFRIYGDQPVISSVSPQIIHKGDTITIRGKDLDTVVPVLEADRNGNINSRYIKISASPDSADGYFSIYDWKLNDSGTEITFLSPENPYVFDNGRYKPASPTPSEVKGPIHLVKAGSNQLSIHGPALTWRQADMTIRKASIEGGTFWPGANILIVKDEPHTTLLRVEGTGLDGATFKVGSTSVQASGQPDGRLALLDIVPSTASGKVTVTKGSASATSTEEFKIIPAPAFLPNTIPQGRWVIKMDQVIEARGWDLKSTAVDGLTYDFSDQAAARFGCKYDFELISYTASSIKFKLKKTGTVPADCTRLDPQIASMRFLTITAKYNGVERKVWSKEFDLQP